MRLRDDLGQVDLPPQTEVVRLPLYEVNKDGVLLELPRSMVIRVEDLRAALDRAAL